MKIILCLFFRYNWAMIKWTIRRGYRKYTSLIACASALKPWGPNLGVHKGLPQGLSEDWSWWYYLQDACFGLHVVQRVGSLRPSATVFSGNKSVWLWWFLIPSLPVSQLVLIVTSSLRGPGCPVATKGNHVLALEPALFHLDGASNLCNLSLWVLIYL